MMSIEFATHGGYSHTHKAEEMLSAMGLAWGDIEALQTLDVGAGSCALGKAAQERGIAVHSVDDESNIGIPETAFLLEPWFSGVVPYTRADARKLPFSNDSFDVSLSHCAPPVLGIVGMREIRRCIAEVMRVTRREFRFTPGDLVSTFVEPQRIGEQQKFAMQDRRYFERITRKSHALLRQICPEIEIRTGDGADYCVIRKAKS